MSSKTAALMSIRSQSIDSPLETSRPALSLLFQPDDPTRTDIIDGNTGHLYYSVDTIKQRKYQLTLVRRAASPIDGPSTVGEETTVASFEWHRYRSDMISFGDNMPISVKDWLKRSMNPFNTTVSFKNQTWKAYQWKGNSAGLSLTVSMNVPVDLVATTHAYIVILRQQRITCRQVSQTISSQQLSAPRLAGIFSDL
ncbi:hypothetical protein ARMSODRAFT_398821 [Armillaria solidipes]|uniref:DUF6593 domain-containing protein n=1 Tax=Armillaria solidipes TaxID=1076256 RepID=A0A2H3CJZ0_9AGAR|nr:hypothetical protein ARMSODRAFT_398821 [Armillaria solidipes]